MRELVWEWLLADGSKVRAAYDRRRREESVWVGRRLVSRAPVGTKAAGHSIATSIYRDVELRVAFDVENERCTLRRGEDFVAPCSWPETKRDRVRDVPLPAALGIMVGLTVAFVAAHLMLTREPSWHVDRSAGVRRHVDRSAGVRGEPAFVNLVEAVPAPPVVLPALRPSRPVRSLPNARALAVAPRKVPSLPPRTFVSSSRPPASGFTVDVVCDAQGACQGVRPVRLSVR